MIREHLAGNIKDNLIVVIIIGFPIEFFWVIRTITMTLDISGSDSLHLLLKVKTNQKRYTLHLDQNEMFKKEKLKLQKKLFKTICKPIEIKTLLNFILFNKIYYNEF